MSPPELAGDIAAVILADLWHNQPQGADMPDNLPPDAYEALYDVMKHDQPDRMDGDRARFWALVHQHPDRLHAAARWWHDCPDTTTVDEARRVLLGIAEGRQEATA